MANYCHLFKCFCILICQWRIVHNKISGGTEGIIRKILKIKRFQCHQFVDAYGNTNVVDRNTSVSLSGLIRSFLKTVNSCGLLVFMWIVLLTSQVRVTLKKNLAYKRVQLFMKYTGSCTNFYPIKNTSVLDTQVMQLSDWF
jgi:hypothetical protein